MSGRGNANRCPLPRFGQRRELRPAGVRQAEEPSDLVECFAGGIVERLADDPVAADAGDLDQLRVPARHQQRQERKVGRRLLEHAGEQMALEVMDGDRWDLEAVGQRRRQRAADHQRANEAWTGRIRDSIEVAEPHPGLGEHAFDHRQELRNVIARRELRHHAAVGGVDRDLARQPLSADAGAGLVQGYAGLVAARFDS